MPPESWCGYSAARRSSLGDLHQLQHLDGSPHRLGAAEPLVQLHALGDLPADAQHRVERGHRLLEDHRDAVAADGAHLALGECEKVAASVAHGAGMAPRRHRHEAQDRERGDALAAARFADDAERLAVAHAERHAVDRAHRADEGVEGGAEVVTSSSGGLDEAAVASPLAAADVATSLTAASPGADRARRAGRRRPC
jgi:hypothetical protein